MTKTLPRGTRELRLFKQALLAAFLFFSALGHVYAQCGADGNTTIGTNVVYSPTTSFQSTGKLGSDQYQHFSVSGGNIYSFYVAAVGTPGTPIYTNSNDGNNWDMTIGSPTLDYNGYTSPMPNSWDGGIWCQPITPASADWYNDGVTYTGGTVDVILHEYGTGCLDFTNPSPLSNGSAIIEYKSCPAWASDPGPGTGGNWNVEAFLSIDTALYGNPARYGYYVDGTSGLTFNSTNYWANNQTPANASTWHGCNLIPPQNWTIRARRTGIPCGAYTFTVNNADDNIEILVDGIDIYHAAYPSPTGVINGGTAYVIRTNSVVDIRLTALCGTNNISVTMTKVTAPALTAGSISGNQTICATKTPTTISSTGFSIGRGWY